MRVTKFQRNMIVILVAVFIGCLMWPTMHTTFALMENLKDGFDSVWLDYAVSHVVDYVINYDYREGF